MLRWVAEYSDGSTVRDGQISYVDIDRAKLKKLALADEDGNVVASVSAEDEKIPFYRIYTFGVGKQFKGRFWMIGWRKRGAQEFTVIYEDGRQEQYNTFNVNPFIYEPDWYSFENP